MASRDSMEVGDLIGRLVDERYKILEPMASGSMGAVFKAERVPVGKQVAIKFLHAAFAKDSEFLTRFERETRVMSKLAHPNCVSVVDFGVFEGSPYFVMDYVAGKTLRTILDDEPLGPMRALSIARQIAAGLAHAHAQDVIHRDIKPANIMISDEIGAGEHARILDFGLARLRGAVGQDATQINVVVGTPNYMAPEQTVGGGTIDARTDIYAVGVVLFEMIAGERPFQAEDTLALLGMHRGAPIPKLADRLDRTIVLPDGVQKLIEKAMAKVPGDRYQTAIEFADAIDEITGSKKLPEPPGQVVRRRIPTPATGTAASRSDAAVASTMLDVKTDRANIPTPASTPASTKSTTSTGLLVVLLLLLGGGAAAWSLWGRASKPTTAGTGVVARIDASAAVIDTGSGSAAVIDPASGSATVEPGSGSATPDPGSGSAAVGSGDEGSGSGSAIAGSGADSSSGSGGSGGSGSGETVGSGGSGSGSGPGVIEMDPDPMAAENVAPKAPETDDEAADAPVTDEDVEKLAPKAPVLATTIHDAVLLLKDGKSELALSSLRALWKKQQNSAYIPFLLGNLYFDKSWWSIAMDHYRIAIIRNGGYQKNPVLIRNIIRMLSSERTRAKADYFLRKTIGKSAVVYLKVAASPSERNPTVRKYAAGLAKAISGR